jgi:hypothetical protein
MYFEQAGKQNTEETLRIAVAGAKERGLTHLVLASTVGATARAALPLIAGTGLHLVVVTHNVGFKEEGKDEFDPAVRAEVEKVGHRVLTATMVTRNLNKNFFTKWGGYTQTDLVTASLRMFGEGAKVCAEIAAMACDAGLIPFADVVAVAGTSRGADTAVVLRANSSNRFFEIKFKEILCKPKNF